MKKIKTRLEDFIHEGMENDPYGEEEWGSEREQRIQQVIDKYEAKWASSASGKAQEFIEVYTHKQDLDDAEREDRDYDDDDDDFDPNDEVYLLATEFGIHVGREIGEPSTYGTCNVTTEDWCDFFNDLVEAGW